MQGGYRRSFRPLKPGLLVILAILAVSCRTLSPLTAPAEILSVRTPAELQPRWEPFAEETGPGLA
jgi:hypothetical protein